MTSPRLAFYASNIRTRQQAESAIADRAYWEIVDRLLLCPCCGIKPSIDPAFHNQFCVYCDTDDCMPHQMQAMAPTLKDAVMLWNERMAEWDEENTGSFCK